MDKDLADIVDNPEEQFQLSVKALGIIEPCFSLCLYPEGLAMFEEKANVAFTFSRHSSDANSAWINDTARLMFPDWALKHLQYNLENEARLSSV